MRPISSVSGRLLAKNTSWNLLGKIIPVALGFITIPFIVRELGVEQFGLLSLAWLILGYFSLFDIGMGQAMTKFVSQGLAESRHDYLAQLIWTALVAGVIIGFFGTVSVALAVPLMVGSVLAISEELISVAKNSLLLLSIAVPLAVTMSTLRGTIEGAQRFDLVNAVKIPYSSLLFLMPAVLLKLGHGLEHIILFLVILQAVAACAYFILCSRLFSLFGHLRFASTQPVFALLRFGGWVSGANIAFSLLGNIEIFFIGAFLTVEAVGFYAPVAALAARFLIIPESLTSLLPTFSALTGQKERAANYYRRISKHILFGMGAVLILFALLAEPILHIWLGSEFANISATALQFLALGTLGYSISVVTNGLINGFGRPDILAKFRFAQLPIYGVALWYGIVSFGIAGAACVWMIRAFLDAIIVFIVSSKLLHLRLEHMIRNGIGRATYTLVLGGILLWLATQHVSGGMYVGTLLAGAIAFIIVWRYYILDLAELTFVRSFWKVPMQKLFHKNQ
jgi:O-antigen/teichoic acid export membrane protein